MGRALSEGQYNEVVALTGAASHIKRCGYKASQKNFECTLYWGYKIPNLSPQFGVYMLP